MDTTETLIGLGSVPAILVLVQVFKGFISDTRLYPVLGIGLGVVVHILISMALGHMDGPHMAQHVLQGVMVGLAASGLYSSVDTFREGSAANKANRK